MATKHMNLEGMLDFPPKMWKQIGVTGITFIKTRTQKGRGVKENDKGYTFRPYSENYGKLKASGMTRKDGSKLKAFKGVSTDRQVSPPNFRLRNRTMRDLTLRAVTRRSVVIGWRNEAATIVAGHMERGKYMVGGVTVKEQKELLKIVDKEMQHLFKTKTNDVSVTVKV